MCAAAVGCADVHVLAIIDHVKFIVFMIMVIMLRMSDYTLISVMKKLVLRLKRRQCHVTRMISHTVQFSCHACHLSCNFVIPRNFILTLKLEQKFLSKIPSRIMW